MENILDDMFGNSSQFTENQDQSQAIYTKVGSNLEEIIWPHAKKLHHVTHHRRNKGSTDSGQTNEEYDDFDTRVKKEMVKCELCKSHASAYKMDMSGLRIIHSKPEYSSSDPPAPTAIKLFDTKYFNKMTISQKFSFETKRKTTSAATVELIDPVFYGSEGCKLALGLPEEIKKDNPVFGEEVEPSKAKEEFNKEITWSVSHFIECPPRKTTKVSLMLEEHRYSSNFTLESAMNGTVTVTVQKERMKKPQYVTIDIAKLIRKYNKKLTDNQMSRFEVDKQGNVTYTTKGRCKFVYGVNQYISLETLESESTCCTIM